MNVDLNQPANVFQLMTGITEEYRGQRLGRWLKAVMFRRLAEDFPSNEKITTSTRSLNRPMQAINDEMGFKLFRRGCECQLTSEIVEAYLTGAG